MHNIQNIASLTYKGKNIPLLLESMVNTPSGTLAGTATYDATNDWVQLINNQGNTTGSLNYTVNGNLLKITPFGMKQDWYRSGSADGMRFYWGCTGVTTGGYALVLDFFNNRINLLFNGADVSGFQTPLTVPNASFVPVVVTVLYLASSTRITASVNGVVRFDYTDLVRSLPGNNYGWQAYTGGQVSIQRIKNLNVYRL